MMQQNNQPNTGINTARILNIAMMLAVIIYCLILYIFLPSQDISIYLSDDPMLQYLGIIFAVISIAVIVVGYYLPLRFIKISFHTAPGIISVYLLRLSLFESVGVFGLMLGILGAEWLLSLPFIIVCAVLLILIFPTREKWHKMLDKYSANLEK